MQIYISAEHRVFRNLVLQRNMLHLVKFLHFQNLNIIHIKLLLWKPLNVITLVKTISDHRNQMVTLTVITLSGFDCITIL